MDLSSSVHTDTFGNVCWSTGSGVPVVTPDGGRRRCARRETGRIVPDASCYAVASILGARQARGHAQGRTAYALTASWILCLMGCMQRMKTIVALG